MAANRPRRLVHQFLDRTTLTRTITLYELLILLASNHSLKYSVKSKLLWQGNNIRRRLRELARPLETKEAEIQLVGIDIQHLEAAVEDGTDGENNNIFYQSLR